MQKLLVTAILNTDALQHDPLLESVQHLVSANSPPELEQLGEHNRLTICSFLLHCADISNAAKPFHIAERWTDLIMK